MNKFRRCVFVCNMNGGLGDIFLTMLLLIHKHFDYIEEDLIINFIHDNDKYDFNHFKKLFLLEYPKKWQILNQSLNKVDYGMYHENFRVYEKLYKLDFRPFFNIDVKTNIRISSNKKTVTYKIYVHDIHTQEDITKKLLNYKSISNEQYELVKNLFSKYKNQINFVEFYDWNNDVRTSNKDVILTDPIEVSNNNLKLINHSDLIICCEGFFSIASNVFKKETVVFCENEGLALLKNDNQYFCKNFNLFLKNIEHQLCILINK